MNWRRGLSRLARALAAAYGALAIVVSAAYGWTEGHVAVQSFEVVGGEGGLDWDVTVMAASAQDAARIVRAYARTHPTKPAEGVHEVLPVGASPSDTAPVLRPWTAVKLFLWSLQFWAIGGAILAGLYLGVKWVTLGFLEKEPPPAAPTTAKPAPPRPRRDR